MFNYEQDELDYFDEITTSSKNQLLYKLSDKDLIFNTLNGEKQENPLLNQQNHFQNIIHSNESIIKVNEEIESNNYKRTYSEGDSAEASSKKRKIIYEMDSAEVITQRKTSNNIINQNKISLIKLNLNQENENFVTLGKYSNNEENEKKETEILNLKQSKESIDLNFLNDENQRNEKNRKFSSSKPKPNLKLDKTNKVTDKSKTAAEKKFTFFIKDDENSNDSSENSKEKRKDSRQLTNIINEIKEETYENKNNKDSKSLIYSLINRNNNDNDMILYNENENSSFFENDKSRDLNNKVFTGFHTRNLSKDSHISKDSKISHFSKRYPSMIIKSNKTINMDNSKSPSFMRNKTRDEFNKKVKFGIDDLMPFSNKESMKQKVQTLEEPNNNVVMSQIKIKPEKNERHDVHYLSLNLSQSSLKSTFTTNRNIINFRSNSGIKLPSSNTTNKNLNIFENNQSSLSSLLQLKDMNSNLNTLLNKVQIFNSKSHPKDYKPFDDALIEKSIKINEKRFENSKKECEYYKKLYDEVSKNSYLDNCTVKKSILDVDFKKNIGIIKDMKLKVKNNEKEIEIYEERVNRDKEEIVSNDIKHYLLKKNIYKEKIKEIEKEINEKQYKINNYKCNIIEKKQKVESFIKEDVYKKIEDVNRESEEYSKKKEILNRIKNMLEQYKKHIKEGEIISHHEKCLYNKIENEKNELLKSMEDMKKRMI